MKKIFAILAAASVASCIQYDGLRVKFGWSDALADIDHFFKIPRTIPEAEAEGWRRTQRYPDAALPELRMYCPLGRAVCPLFDSAGFVAGLQIAIPIDDWKPPLSWGFTGWHVKSSDVEPYGGYYTITQYFVSEESLKAGAGPQVENGATLQDGGVWVNGPDNRLMRIPSTEAELNSTAFKKQNCVPNMGTHYYYNMTPAMSCTKLLPWFALTTHGELIGTGFQYPGRLAKPLKHRQWFEDTPYARQGVQIAIPDAPTCLLDWATKYGVLSLHIYYVDQPWKIRCRAGDSVKPAPAFDRMLLTGYRYVSQISDEFKKFFSG